MTRRRGGRSNVRWGGIATLLTVLVGGLALSGSPPVEAAPVGFSSTPLASDRLDGEGLAVLQVGGRVYVGGMFGRVTGPTGASVGTRANLAAFDAATGRLVSTFRADVDGPVRALATDGARLFVGGSFATVGGVRRDRLAAVSLATGAVDAGWVANANSNVYGLAVRGSTLYAVGSFSWLNGSARSRIAAVSTASGTLRAFAPSLDATTYGIAVSPDGTRVYVGGNFTSVSGVAAKWLVSLDAGTGLLSPIQFGEVGGPAGTIEVAPDGTRVVASLMGTANAGTTWRVSDGRRLWRQRCDGDAQAIGLVGDKLFSGFHEGCEGNTTIRLTANDHLTGARETAFAPTFDKFWGVRSIAGTSEVLAIAGDFTRISGVAVSGFALFPSLHTPPPTTTTTAAPTTTLAPTTTTTVAPTTTTTVAPTTTTTTAPPPPTTGFPIALRSTWRYRYDGAVPPADWRSPTFVDSSWSQGAGQLGYGDGDEATLTTPGNQGTDHPLAAYFRRSFTLGSIPAGPLRLQLVADDGAVVYLNGVEVARDGMPAGAVGPTTYALTNRSGADENAVRTFTVPTSALRAGTNVLAVEVHQNYRTSSDLSFDAALS